VKAMPKIYLSYAHQDEKQVQELYQKLSRKDFLRHFEDWSCR
jgi:hypothetical protein